MRHGAVLYRSGRLLAIGRNRSRVHDRWVVDRRRADCTVHAEVAALRDLDVPRQTGGATILVVRVGRTGALRPSAPCRACWHALEAAGVRRVVHS